MWCGVFLFIRTDCSSLMHSLALWKFQNTVKPSCLKRPLKGSKKIRPPKTGGLLTQVHYIEKCTVGV